MDFYLSLSLVRSSFPWHFETGFENAREGWVDFKCTLVLLYLCSVVSIVKFFFVIKGLVYRYDVSKSSDGVAGEEGTFCMCTLWYVFFFFLPSLQRNTRFINHSLSLSLSFLLCLLGALRL